MAKKNFTLFVSWKMLIFLFAFLATFVLPLYENFVTDIEFKKDYPYYIWIWGNFDGFHYMDISKHGYTYYQHPFFPLFPALMYILAHFLHIKRLIGGQLIANSAFLLSVSVAYKLLLLDKKRSLFSLLGLVIILFPTSFFYGAVYNDSLFFFLASLCIYYARKKLWGRSSIFGAIATLTRLNGLALVFIILFEYLTQNSPNPNDTWNVKKLYNYTRQLIRHPAAAIRHKLYAICFIPLSFLSYLLYTRVFFGDWNKIFTSMKAWDQDKITFPLQVIWRYLKILTHIEANRIVYSVAVLELLFVLFFIGLLIYSYKKIRLSYWLFFAISILIPSLTGTFQGMPRYGLHIYPFFLSIALLLEKKSRTIKLLYFTLSIILLFYCITLFTRGYFIA